MIQMTQKFWLKLSVILLTGILCLSFSLSWLFSIHQSHRLNYQQKAYLSENFFFLYKHIQFYLKKNPQPSFSRIQKIISRYSGEALNRSFMKMEPTALTEEKNKSSEKSFFLIKKSGLIRAHSESHYQGKKLQSSSPFLSLIQQYPKGWNLTVEQDGFPPLMTIARPVVVSSVDYFIVASRPTILPGRLFLSYFKSAFLLGLVFFTFLFLFIFLYLKAFVHSAHFLFRLFGNGYKTEQKRALFYLAHTNNSYLKNIRWDLTSILQANKKKEHKKSNAEITFSDVVKKVVYQSNRLYPALRIHTDLVSDIPLPVFADKLFQSLWELVKNAVQALPNAGQIGQKEGNQVKTYRSALKIRTFKKNNRWFCCEVEDQGPGMDEDTIQKAGALYFTTKKHFTGLGLTFVESVLSRMGGIMKLQSSENGGLNVCLVIPLDYICHIQNMKKSVNKKDIFV